jgi:Protein of unknown function (DUF3267).
MTLKWKGRLSEKNTFPKNNVPTNAVRFLNPKSQIEPYLGVIPILVLVIACIYFKRNFIIEFTLDIKGMIIGIILTMPFLIIHEFLHAICFPRDGVAEIFWSPAGISIIPCNPISKLRYTITLIVPAIIIGLIPLFIWTSVPFSNTTLSSIVFILSIGNLGGTSNDMYNLYQAIKVMPKNSYMITSKTNCYYFKKGV